MGYSVSFDKTTFRLLRGESNLWYTFSSWENGHLHVAQPDNIHLQWPTVTLIYDEKGNLLWSQRPVPWLVKHIDHRWLKSDGFHDLEATCIVSRELVGNDNTLQTKISDFHGNDNELTHSVAVNVYPATPSMPALSIVVVDTIPNEFKHSWRVWSWFTYALIANLLLVIPLLWGAARWSLLPIAALAKEVRELEKHSRKQLNPDTSRELSSLVRNLNGLVKSERERYNKYRTTLTDLTHSLKTPLAVLQSTLRLMRSHKLSMEDAEPIMLEQISRISQQTGYFLHRASMRSTTALLGREIHAVAPLLDSLISALNKVYQRKGVDITLDISPEVLFIGDKNDFMEVMGNVLDNACKYCLEFVEVTARIDRDALWLMVDDDGPGIPESKRPLIFDRGQRIDTLRPGQGVGLSVVQEIINQYDGNIIIEESILGGTRMSLVFNGQMVETM